MPDCYEYRMQSRPLLGAALAAGLVWNAPLAQSPPRFLPGDDVLLDAHNAYPHQGRWGDRVERALAAGTPLAIEQDLVWLPATEATPARSIVSHGAPFTGEEAMLRDLFERLRPMAERAVDTGSRDQWPIVTLNLDFKDSHPEHFTAIWQLLGEYELWLTTARRSANTASVQPFEVGPILVLTGADPAQQAIFHDAVPIGSRLRLFGAVRPGSLRATNYHRWSNNPWSVVEPEGQPQAGEWTDDDHARLRSTVDAAHAAELWIRFYTLNGHSSEDGERMGWSPGYNFGSIDAARTRWHAAIDAGVDFIATDQYEDFAHTTR